jgi:hypothetical protein
MGILRQRRTPPGTWKEGNTKAATYPGKAEQITRKDHVLLLSRRRRSLGLSSLTLLRRLLALALSRGILNTRVREVLLQPLFKLLLLVVRAGAMLLDGVDLLEHLDPDAAVVATIGSLGVQDLDGRLAALGDDGLEERVGHELRHGRDGVQAFGQDALLVRAEGGEALDDRLVRGGGVFDDGPFGVGGGEGFGVFGAPGLVELFVYVCLVPGPSTKDG